ncbi:MAG: hypothetical protein KAI53_02110 [Candidatus Aenigmarchaeota archaeon]|nr:hypothetical protein [Candidatus Aenigmarchaeota archaeon]
MSVVSTAFQNLERLGFYDYIFPWLLFLALIFGILQSKKVISEEVSVNGVISIVLSFLIVFIGKGIFYTKIFGLLGVVLAGVLVGIIVLGAAGYDFVDAFFGNKALAGVVLGIMMILVFISAGGLEFFRISSDIVATILMLVLMIGAVAFLGATAK